MTRSQAIRFLQLGLKDFRKLCILKGIYPREPKRKYKGNNKTYYHIKDIKFLENDKILTTFREINAHMKKITRMEGRREEEEVKILKARTPVYTLQHLIKERFPTFIDALRDLDDCLCLVALFAAFPSHKLLNIPRETVKLCQRLHYEFMLYCTISKSFKKTFLSIKGIYYQAEIMGQNITWVVPYKFTSKLPFEVDYTVMNTFIEFYMASLKFVNFKLFSDFQMEYPPVRSDLASLDSYSLDFPQIDTLQAHIEKTLKDAEGAEEISEEFRQTEEYQQLIARETQIKKKKDLFGGKVFFLNRETPIYSLEYLILGFGGKICKDESDASITHHVIDRPLRNKSEVTRDYVLPQWIYDSLNNQICLPVA